MQGDCTLPYVLRDYSDLVVAFDKRKNHYDTRQRYSTIKNLGPSPFEVARIADPVARVIPVHSSGRISDPIFTGIVGHKRNTQGKGRSVRCPSDARRRAAKLRCSLAPLRRQLAKVISVMQTRRAVRKLFCRHCGQDMFNVPIAANLYCSDDCLDRDLTRLEYGAQIY